ncbi:MAG: sigma 54-interacting transcriptional regulator [Planctomycetes bacterium]|nr:sigma 54-interacting transcriptional regulator [Planctomycetota bacterium]
MSHLPPDRSAEKELETLHKISQAVVRKSDVSILLKEVLDILEKGMGLDRATLTLRKPDSDIFVIEVSRHLSKVEMQRGQYRLGEGITGTVAKTGRPIIVPDISKEEKFLDRTRSRCKTKVAFLCVPIVHNQMVIGTFSIDRAGGDMDALKHELSFMELVMGILADAVSGIREKMEEKAALLAENRRLRQQLDDSFHPSNLLGNCGSMRLVYDQIAQVADSTATVLIRGESGTGKELVAKAIHSYSNRHEEPFICVNCAALPESLIESELFGHEKGSFTGAVHMHQGRFELADKGTIFLDEIGDISPSVQVRLLRVLQEKCFERVGGTKTISVDVRVLAATNQNLEEAIRHGRFREDLYYRLNVFPIHLPALRERRSDIMMLADHFVQKYNKVYGKSIKRISTAAINMMSAYHWPGNVRELENGIERAVLSSSDGVIHGYTLPPSLQTSEETNTSLLSPRGVSLKSMLETYEREIIIDALKKHRGNAAAAARELQTTPRIINYSIRNLGIQPENYQD